MKPVPAIFILGLILQGCFFDDKPYVNSWSTEGSRYPDASFNEEKYGVLQDPDSSFELTGLAMPDSKMRLLLYKDGAEKGDFTYLICSPGMRESILNWYVPRLWNIERGDHLYLHVHGNFVVTDSTEKHQQFYVDFCAAGDEPDTVRYYDPCFDRDYDYPRVASELSTIKSLEGYLLKDSKGKWIMASNSYQSQFHANIAGLIPADHSIEALMQKHYDNFVYDYHRSERYLFVRAKGDFKPLAYPEDNEEFIVRDITFIDSVFTGNVTTFNHRQF